MRVLHYLLITGWNIGTLSDAFNSNMAKYVAKRVTVQSLVSCHQMALNYKIIEQDRPLIVTLCYKISTAYLAQLVTCLPHSLRVMSSRPASGNNFLSYKFCF